MKGTIQLAVEALRKCAEAHHARFEDYTVTEDESPQVAIMSDTVPTVADARSICRAIFGTHDIAEVSCGFITVYLDEREPLEEVDETMLRTALPYGTEL